MITMGMGEKDMVNAGHGQLKSPKLYLCSFTAIN